MIGHRLPLISEKLNVMKEELALMELPKFMRDYDDDKLDFAKIEAKFGHDLVAIDQMLGDYTLNNRSLDNYQNIIVELYYMIW